MFDHSNKVKSEFKKQKQKRTQKNAKRKIEFKLKKNTWSRKIRAERAPVNILSTVSHHNRNERQI